MIVLKSLLLFILFHIRIQSPKWLRKQLTVKSKSMIKCGKWFTYPIQSFPRELYLPRRLYFSLYGFLYYFLPLCLVWFVCPVRRCLWTWISHGLSLVTLKGGHSSMKQTRLVTFHDKNDYLIWCTIWIWEPCIWFWHLSYICSLSETRLPMHLLKVWKWLLVLVRLLSSGRLGRPWMLWLPRLKLLLVCILSNTFISFCYPSSFSLTTGPVMMILVPVTTCSMCITALVRHYVVIFSIHSTHYTPLVVFIFKLHRNFWLVFFLIKNYVFFFVVANGRSGIKLDQCCRSLWTSVGHWNRKGREPSPSSRSKLF